MLHRQSNNVSKEWIKQIFQKGDSQLPEHISKDKLTEIIDGLHLQMVWILVAIDSLEALSTIDSEKLKLAPNFIYITKTSLIYRYSMELAKLCGENEEISINEIRNMCLRHKKYFDASFDIDGFCKCFKQELHKYKTLIENIIGRRRKTYAHNDKGYYLFSQKAIDDFPIDIQEIKSMATIMYNFAKTMQEKIGSKRANLGYPANSDDVKRLFGEKTADDIWLDENENWF